MVDWGMNQTASEMGNLFYNVLGGKAGAAGGGIIETHNANYNLFQNVRPYFYWSSVQFDENQKAWIFAFYDGGQDTRHKMSQSHVWAVHDGDVGPSPVPLPATLLLLTPALAGLRVMRRRAA
jgi:hypothetical protein